MKRSKTDIPKEILFEIARESIRAYLISKKIPDISKYIKLYPKLREKQGSFVTLYIEGQLKGCIGRLEGEGRLIDDIVVNSIDAAFNDSRFSSLTVEEFIKLKMEISLLTKPKKIAYRNEDELFRKIFAMKCGVILRMGVHRSTYLPQVWESYDNPCIFMKELALKGGFSDGVWNEKKCEIYSYRAKVFKED